MAWNRGHRWKMCMSVYTLYSLEGGIWMPHGHMMADVFWMQCFRVCAYIWVHMYTHTVKPLNLVYVFKLRFCVKAKTSPVKVSVHDKCPLLRLLLGTQFNKHCSHFSPSNRCLPRWASRGRDRSFSLNVSGGMGTHTKRVHRLRFIDAAKLTEKLN